MSTASKLIVRLHKISSSSGAESFFAPEGGHKLLIAATAAPCTSTDGSRLEAWEINVRSALRVFCFVAAILVAELPGAYESSRKANSAASAMIPTPAGKLDFARIFVAFSNTVVIHVSWMAPDCWAILFSACRKASTVGVVLSNQSTKDAVKAGHLFFDNSLQT